MTPDEQSLARRFEFEHQLSGVRVQEVRSPGRVIYHYHAEFELALVTGGAGRRVVGDSVESYHDRALVLTGPRLAHGWSFEPDARRVVVHVVTFTRESLGLDLLGRVEFARVAELLAGADRGWHFPHAVGSVADDLAALPAATPTRQFLGLLSILDTLAAAPDRRHITSRSYRPPLAETDHAAFATVLRLIDRRGRGRIALADAADAVHMSVPTFTRFFRRMTGTTFVNYLNEWRIRRACVLLRTTEHRIIDVSLEAGFTNLSHFNRCFRRSQGMTPREFRNAGR
jgi:AraC-like DNA-binding protein